MNKLYKLLIIRTVLLFAVPSVCTAYDYYIPYYDMSGDTYTGIALTNMSQTTAHVSLKYY